LTGGTINAMRTLRFHEYGDPNEVLRLETVSVPEPAPGQLRVAVYACGLAPADWALCEGLFAGTLPRGVGIDLSGSVDAVGEGVADVVVGDLVLGNADWRGSSSAGASDGAATRNQIGRIHCRGKNAHPHLIRPNGWLRNVERLQHVRVAWSVEPDGLQGRSSTRGSRLRPTWSTRVHDVPSLPPWSPFFACGTMPGASCPCGSRIALTAGSMTATMRRAA